MSEERKITCQAEGDRCHGCAHYMGKADVCEYAHLNPTPATELVEEIRKALPKQSGTARQYFIGSSPYSLDQRRLVEHNSQAAAIVIDRYEKLLKQCLSVLQKQE